VPSSGERSEQPAKQKAPRSGNKNLASASAHAGRAPATDATASGTRDRGARIRIIETLRANPQGLCTVELMKAAGITSRNRADVMLHYLHRQGAIERMDRGWYGLPGTLQAYQARQRLDLST
jgi:hypothetical protein